MSAPKAPGALRNGGRLRKLECFACPLDGRPIVYASRSNVAANGAPGCGRCGAQMLFSDPADVLDVCPDRIGEHPLHRDAQIREDRAARAHERAHREACAGCGEPAPAGATPGHFYCAGCGMLTSPGLDGASDLQAITRGSGEWEDAHERHGLGPVFAPLERIAYPRNMRHAARPAQRPAPGTSPAPVEPAHVDPMPF